MNHRSQKGQILVMFVFFLIVGAAVVGVGIDLARATDSNERAHNNAAVACVAAAEAYRRGQIPFDQFGAILQQNGISPDAYSPNQGTGLSLTRGLESRSVGGVLVWRAAVTWREPTVGFVSGILGIHEYTVLGKAQCVGRDSGGLSPIAVRETAIQHSISGGTPQDYAILGRDPSWDLADIESGTNFRGAVFVHMWCVPATDPNCPNVRVFYPLTEEPPSAQTQKKLVEDCFKGINCAIVPGVGQRLPIVSGTSNNQLCRAFQEGGWQVGDKIIVLVFSGEVYSPDPSYSNWENVAVIGYAVYQITAFEPNPNNCNHVLARLYSPYIYSDWRDVPSDVILPRSREIPWEYGGPIPW